MSDVPNDPPPDDEPEPLPPAAKDAPLFAYEPKRCVRCDRRMRTDKAKAVYDLCNPCRRDDFKRAKAERLLPVKSKRTVDEVAELKKQMRIDRGFADPKTLASVVVEGREKLRPSPKELRKQSEIRYQKYIDLLREGHTVMEALAELKIQPPTMYQWRKRWPNLKAEEDAVRVNAGSMRKAQRQRVSKANSQFEDFRKKCFRYDTFWHHRKIIDVIEEGEALANENISMVLVPPEHGKSTLVQDYICYRLGKDPNLRILLVGRKGQVDKIMNTVKRRMTDLGQYATYIETYGPFYTKGQEKLGRPWTQDYIQLALSNNDERDYNLETVSIGTEVQGTRTDLLIVDDIQSLKTLNLSEKYVDMFRQDFLSRVVKTGSTVILGTRVGEDDFYQKLLDLEIVNKLVLLPALVDGEPLWPEQWSPERLEKKRKIVGESAWWRNFMQAPRSEGTNPFTEDMVNQAWDTRIFAEPQDGEAMILGVDPALGGGNAVIAASWKQDRLSIIDCQVDYGLGRTEQILGVIDGFAARYRPQFVVMETTAMQKGFARDDRLAEIAAHWGFTMREHDTAGIKADPVLGVGAMASSFSRGEIRLAAGDDLTRRRLEPLVTELLSWRPDRSGRDLKQDTVMAMWFVWRWWAQARTYAATTGNDFKGRGLPWKSIAWNGPTRYQGVKRDMQRA